MLYLQEKNQKGRGRIFFFSPLRNNRISITRSEYRSGNDYFILKLRKRERQNA